MVKNCWPAAWAWSIVALVVAVSCPVHSAQYAPPMGATPLRLSYVEGNVFFQRPGVADWIPYRIEVSDGRSQLITRRGGRAIVTLGDGQSADIMPSEEVVVQGDDMPTMETYVASEPDSWDSWNLARTDRQIDSFSSRYMPPGVYGGDALDHYGNWRVVPDYGEVWVPDSVPAEWAPYSTGSGCGILTTTGLGLTIALGLGAVPLRALGVPERLLGLGARPCGRSTDLCAGFGRFFLAVRSAWIHCSGFP